MIILENFKMAIESIKSNKMRSFLTMLGIIIGISSVIIIVSAGQGAQNFMKAQFEQVGTTTVMLNVDTEDALDSEYITLDDVYALIEMDDYVKGATPIPYNFGTIRFNDKEMDAQVVGGTESVLGIQNVNMITGTFYSQVDNLSARNVCVIDQIAANRFFGNTDVVGMQIDVFVRGQRIKLQIIGVCESELGEFMYENRPGTLYMPISTFVNFTNRSNRFSMIYIQSYDKADTEKMGNAAVRFLEGRHSNRGREIYTAENMLAQVDMINSVLTLVQNFVAAVAAISLLVGGIGVMNIMLVAVTERTREIGIRKALGARTNAILIQFLTESAILTLIGGIIGLIIGWAGGSAFGSIAGITPVFAPSTIVFTVLFSALVGLFFGIYPARKAAHLHPIEALRHD